MQTSKLYPFMFRFGISFNYLIPKQTLSNIASFFQGYFKNNIELTENEELHLSISISDEEMGTNTSALQNAFTERLSLFGDIDYSNSYLFIDIKKSYSNKFIDDFLFTELDAIITSSLNVIGEKIIFIVFLDEIDIDSRMCDKLYYLHNKNSFLNYCFIFDNEARILKFSDNYLYVEKDLKLLDCVNTITTTALEKFEFKLLRKINHFKRILNNEQTSCVRFFYEGNNCGVELYQLIKSKIIEFYNVDGTNSTVFDLILFSSTRSTWLIEVLNNIGLSIESFYPKEENYTFSGCFDLDMIKDTDRNMKDFKILFVCDFIHTGTTFKSEIVPKILSHFPNSSITYLALLVTDEALRLFNSFNKEKTLQINGRAINYLKEVKQDYYIFENNKQNCPICKYDIMPLVGFETPLQEELNSFEMWYMCEEAGYKIENIFFNGRTSRKIIPDTKQIIKNNGALLANKFEALLRKRSLMNQPEIIVVFSDELNTQTNITNKKIFIEDASAGYFVKCLHLNNANFSYFGIPKSIIDKVEEGHTIVDVSHLSEYKFFFSQLDNIIASKKPIIIFDDINLGFSSFDIIHDLMRARGRHSTPIFTLFDFIDFKHLTPSQYEYLSLYNFKLI
jgi:hypothetical protein